MTIVMKQSATVPDIPSFDPLGVGDVAHHHHHDEHVPENKLLDYEHKMDKHQKRSLLNLIREGILTDESFINITDASTPERVQSLRACRELHTLGTDKENIVQRLRNNLMPIINENDALNAGVFNVPRTANKISSGRFTNGDERRPNDD
ncbi:hypothetical protein TELCIR_12871 [Teladorsagia circumcincta]|uniref:Uncharacterized protein n=1 Tax=Teladorsagia circumcincta TaxID=45464 RepID=A0A2G9U7I7_TELCI|nr:hypothetical protein TELCIR_12871 [Teladorsagia circumcincta]